MQFSGLGGVCRTLTHRPGTGGCWRHLNFVRWIENAARSRTGFQTVIRRRKLKTVLILDPAKCWTDTVAIAPRLCYSIQCYDRFGIRGVLLGC